jgi:ParB-like chromosome segregation protein Spo0J
MTRLRIADLVAAVDDDRPHLDPQRVEEYRRSVDRQRPVVVFETEDGFLLADGHHRIAAAVAEGRDTVEADVRHGSRHDALAYAVAVGASQRGLSLKTVKRHVLDRYGR